MRRFVRLGFGLIALGAAACALPALADQKDPKLPGLFDQLKAAASPEDAGQIEIQIWALWYEAGDAKLDALLQKGEAALQDDDYKTALAAFNQVIKKRPDFAEGYNRRATLYYVMGDYRKSLADIDRTLKLEPRHFGALSGLGLVNVRLDKLEEAAKAYRRVLAIDPQSVSAKASLDQIEETIRKRSI